MIWNEFVVACPEIANLAEQRFSTDQLVLLGTIRKNGSPRITPCEVDLAAGHLFLGMMWQSKKALDLLRNPGLVVHSVPSDRMNPGGDIKLYGKAVDVADPQLRQAFCVSIRRRIDWQPKEPYHLFSLDIEEAAFVRFEEKIWESWHWTPETGLRKEVRPNE